MSNPGSAARKAVDGFGVIVLVIIYGLFLAMAAIAADRLISDRIRPGPEWVHDRGSIYWTCTSDGHALIKDTDTGSTMLARDDRKCDSGG